MDERFEKLRELFELALEMQASYLGLSLADIEERMNVSRRTAQRYAHALEDIFPQIEKLQDEDRKIRWRLPASTLDKMVTFEADELAAIELSASILRNNAKNADADLLVGVERKIRALMKPSAKRRVEPDLEALLQAEGLIVSPGPRPEISTEHVAALRTAIKACSVVKVTYTKMDGSSSTERLHPYGFLHGHRHYLVAKNPDRSDAKVRKYILSNIKNICSLDEYFTPDDNFNLEAYTKQSFGVFAGEIFEVEWRFSEKAAQRAKQYVFHPSQEQQKNADGTLSVNFSASGLQEMAWHLTIWGQDVEVISPPELKELMGKQKISWDNLP